MNGIESLFRRTPVSGLDSGPREIVLALLSAFVIGQLIAWVYKRTHSGLSYSRSFTESLVLITMVVSLVMFVIGDSIVTAFGLIGALAIIRFRNVLKDTRDTVFVFFALVLGMAIGTQRIGEAVVGSVLLLSAAAYLHWVKFGTNGLFDGHVSFRASGEGAEAAALDVLERFCRRFRALSVRRGDGASEFVFVVSLRDAERGADLLADLERLEAVGHASLVLQDELSEQ